ncbi:terminase small subunit [Pseudomonas sp. TNT2022 ID357]|uniref:Terminase small subunit n=1 Tax=Pseudomonas idahonensis TaxID=2942628 RepID=A0ABT5Q865_9PSED|nr:terminase small subunit [Pseudomonas idahonensis]MDD1150394.1 terminase small subunit [Pseudomonas idahonensis]
MALTDKKRRFADALLSGASNRAAAIEAGYSEKTASQAGSKLAKDPDVLAHMERKKAVEKAKDEARVEGKSFNLQDLSRMFSDPLQFLKAVMNDGGEDMKLRVEAAKTMMPYVHGKIADQGKKESKKAAANSASKGRFGPSPPPKLVVDNR